MDGTFNLASLAGRLVFRHVSRMHSSSNEVFHHEIVHSRRECLLNSLDQSIVDLVELCCRDSFRQILPGTLSHRAILETVENRRLVS